MFRLVSPPLAVAVLLAACAGDPTIEAPPAEGVHASAPSPVPVDLPEDVSLGLLAERPGGLAGFTVDTVSAPTDLVGMDSGQIALLFGEPRFVRSDPPARIWQFGNERCLLDLFLYPGRDGLERVDHAEVRGRGVFAADPAACLARLLAKKAG